MTDQLVWFKSSYSDSGGGDCVEVAYDWRKSNYSDSSGGECVEVAYDWRKSNHSDSSGGQCVEVAANWHKSSHSDSTGGDCVEVAPTPAAVHVRDSKNPTGPNLCISSPAWSAFLAFATR
ncbi:DUF397 domain-containing protein [Streptomyces sp. NPDC005322]|uniref:DUF397 domain-containing protein n=1 Tax=unclassified Streptomyces TaxID=2593676 RepID=UPI0033AF7DC8